MKKPTNTLQALQDASECEFIVHGVSDWKSTLAAPIQLPERWAELCGGSEVAMTAYIEKEAEINHHSLERSIVHAFLRLGYVLKELEVDIIYDAASRTWGRCVWYPKHPEYDKPVPQTFVVSKLNNPAYYYAMFRTEHAGDQTFCLYSLQMLSSSSILFHKTLLYRKVVFSPPPKVVDQEAG